MARILIGRTSNRKRISIDPESPESFIADLLLCSDRDLFDILLVLEELPNDSTTGVLTQDIVRLGLAWIRKTLSPRTVHFFLRELGLESADSKSRFARSLMSGDWMR